ncbi:hypothetical protein [Xanthomonas euvesicatoria]|uniref:hypothetical protein n=1 Tax=Xanthomonas euvesicatoria TaxID=456327 RepID=UPI00062D5682|nr:hypothetical protein [Xanthomonas euvesicatoria]KLA50000.1 hypothetical protein XEUV685_21960 [Xanthomonas euvesicatoria]KLA54490.1 hypothetical protein XEUV684_19070 [Xanthomonas euvesicatoria]KLA55006.1 hypothetical protein XEUV683_05825 [Xanthomonas euvesicatoria]KLA62839.1 hypothetical protein XEUV695_21690 [Xanthomonas euvesicatoria]KLA63759.1 hypothetical protein XEUV689_19490 [Xanthomonas euvesicatoria]
MANSQPIKLSALRDLADAGSVRGVSVVGLKGGYAVSVRVGMSERTLALSNSSEPRVFSTIDSVARALRPIGIAAFDVNASGYEPGLVRPSRPDAATRLRKNSAAVQHDEWFRRQVQDSLDNPNPKFFSEAEAAAELAEFAASLDAEPAATKKPALRRAAR